MAHQEVQTADAHARITLPATFADSPVVVELLSPSEVRVRKVAKPADHHVGSEDLMRLAEASGAFDFWHDPAEDIYGPDDGEPA